MHTSLATGQSALQQKNISKKDLSSSFFSQVPQFFHSLFTICSSFASCSGQDALFLLGHPLGWGDRSVQTTLSCKPALLLRGSGSQSILGKLVEADCDSASCRYACLTTLSQLIARNISSSPSSSTHSSVILMAKPSWPAHRTHASSLLPPGASLISNGATAQVRAVVITSSTSCSQFISLHTASSESVPMGTSRSFCENSRSNWLAGTLQRETRERREEERTICLKAPRALALRAEQWWCILARRAKMSILGNSCSSLKEAKQLRLPLLTSCILVWALARRHCSSSPCCSSPGKARSASSSQQCMPELLLKIKSQTARQRKLYRPWLLPHTSLLAQWGGLLQSAASASVGRGELIVDLLELTCRCIIMQIIPFLLLRSIGLYGRRGRPHGSFSCQRRGTTVYLQPIFSRPGRLSTLIIQFYFSLPKQMLSF